MNYFHLPVNKKSLDERRMGEITESLGDRVKTKEATTADARRTLEYLAWLLDESIEIPMLKFRFGLDSIIGLLPGVGDLASAGLSAYLIANAARLGVPKTVLAQMFFNSAIDACIGLVPVLGDAFDVVFKSNKRNLKLVIESLNGARRGKHLARKNFVWMSIGLGSLVLLPLGLIVATLIAIVGL